MRLNSHNNKILMLVLEFHPVFTGHGIYLQQLCKFLKNIGFTVEVLAADYNSLPRCEVINNLTVHRFGFTHKERFWELRLALRVVQFLIRNRNSYDILHIHGHLDIYGLLTLCNLFLGKRTITQMVLLGADDPMALMRTYKFMRLRFKILALMDRFICISKVLGESYQCAGLPMQKLSYIPQGVDVERFAPVASTEEKELIKASIGLSSCGDIVIFVGAIVERKGVDLLVDAWCLVQKKHPHATLVFVGQDIFDENDINKIQLNSFVEGIKEQISTNRLNAYFLGKRLDVEKILQVADVLVLPSRKEGFGNVILEGMASGLPVVVTYMDGVALETVVHGKNGYIVNNVSELADSLVLLLDDKEMSFAMGKAGREMVLESFSMSAIAQQYAGVYREITGDTMSQSKE
jgi:glycosyltransferase involved in cell wall biosynthesis